MRVAIGQTEPERRHVGRRNPVENDVDDGGERRGVTETSVQIRAGAALAAGAVTPGALRIEDPTTRRGFVDDRRRGSRLRGRDRRQRQSQATRMNEDVKPSSHAADYTAA